MVTGANLTLFSFPAIVTVLLSQSVCEELGKGRWLVLGGSEQSGSESSTTPLSPEEPSQSDLRALGECLLTD